MSNIQKKVIYNDINKYNIPVFEITSAELNGRLLNEFVPSTCLINASFNNVNENNNCIQFIRKVKLADTNSQIQKIGNYSISNPYFTNNAPLNEYHLCSLYLRPNYYNNIDEIIDAMNESIFTIRNNLFYNTSTMKTITINGNYNGKFTSAINIKNTIYNNATVSQPSTITIGNNYTKNSAITVSNYMDELNNVLSIYNYINKGVSNVDNTVLYNIPTKAIVSANPVASGNLFNTLTAVYREYNTINPYSNIYVRVEITNCSNINDVSLSYTFTDSITQTYDGVFKMEINFTPTSTTGFTISLLISPGTSTNFGTLIGNINIVCFALDENNNEIEYVFVDKGQAYLNNISVINDTSGVVSFLNSDNLGILYFPTNYTDTFNYYTLFSYPKTSISTTAQATTLINNVNTITLPTTKFNGDISQNLINDKCIDISTVFIPKLIESKEFLPIIKGNNITTGILNNITFKISPITYTSDFKCQGIIYSIIYDVLVTFIDMFCTIFNNEDLYNMFIELLNSHDSSIWFYQQLIGTGNDADELFNGVEQQCYNIIDKLNVINDNLLSIIGKNNNIIHSLFYSLFTTYYSSYTIPNPLAEQYEIRRLLGLLNVAYKEINEINKYGFIQYVEILTPPEYIDSPILWFNSLDFVNDIPCSISDELLNEVNDKWGNNNNSLSLSDFISTYVKIIYDNMSEITNNNVSSIINHPNNIYNMAPILPSIISYYTSYYGEEKQYSNIKTFLNWIESEPQYTHYKFVPSGTSYVGYVDVNGKVYGENEFDIVLNNENYNQLFPNNVLSISRLTNLYVENTTITNNTISVYSNGNIIKNDSDNFITASGGNIVRFRLSTDLVLTNGGKILKGSEWEVRNIPYDPNGYYNSTTNYNKITISGSGNILAAIVNPPNDQTLNDYLTTKGLTISEPETVTIAGNPELLNDIFYQKLFYMNPNDEIKPFMKDVNGNIVCMLDEIIPVYVGLSSEVKTIYKKFIVNYDSNNALYYPDLIRYNNNQSYEINNNTYNIQKYINSDKQINQNILKYRKNEIGLWSRIGMLSHNIINQNIFYKFVKNSYYTDEIFVGDIIINADVCNVSNLITLNKGYKIMNKLLFIYDSLLFNNTVPKVANVSLTTPSSIKFKIQITENIEEIVNTINNDDFNGGIQEITIDTNNEQKLIIFSNLEKITIPDGKTIYLYITDYEQPYSLRNGMFKLVINYI